MKFRTEIRGELLEQLAFTTPISFKTQICYISPPQFFSPLNTYEADKSNWGIFGEIYFANWISSSFFFLFFFSKALLKWDKREGL